MTALLAGLLCLILGAVGGTLISDRRWATVVGNLNMMLAAARNDRAAATDALIALASRRQADGTFRPQEEEWDEPYVMTDELDREVAASRRQKAEE